MPQQCWDQYLCEVSYSWLPTSPRSFPAYSNTICDQDLPCAGKLEYLPEGQFRSGVFFFIGYVLFPDGKRKEKEHCDH